MALFRRFDLDKSGKLDLREVVVGLRGLGVALSGRAERAFIKDADTTGDGEISPDEFFSALKRYRALHESDPEAAEIAVTELLSFMADEEAYGSVYALFTAIDKDGSGSLDLAELTAGCTDVGLKLTPRELRALQRALDVNGDGCITFAELMHSVQAEQLRLRDKNWREVTSSAGEAYWYNDFSGETSWDPPQPAGSAV